MLCPCALCATMSAMKDVELRAYTFPVELRDNFPAEKRVHFEQDAGPGAPSHLRSDIAAEQLRVPHLWRYSAALTRL